MPATKDCKFEYLRSQLYEGTVADMEYAYLIALGATPGHIQGMWIEYMTTQLIPVGNYNDMMYAYLVSLGITASALPDMENEYWCGLAP